tara:strand:- start:292 stop:432 length:141 start_codon:yes stop_codon:yes gene_type:complete
MAKRGSSSMGAFEKVKVGRKGVHAKTKTSKSKKSKHYKKSYRGQGR